MNISPFIARRIVFNRQKSFSRFIIRLATTATAISVAAMILTLAFVNGFQDAISQKIFSFWGHVRVQQYEAGMGEGDEQPLYSNSEVVNIIKKIPGVNTVQGYATKYAVMENNKDIEGVLIKGVDAQYNFSKIAPFLKHGRWVSFTEDAYSREIVISQQNADALKLKLNDEASFYFISSAENRANLRKLKVVGIYKTGIEEYDKLYAIGDMRLIRRMNDWDSTQIGGYEVFLNDYKNMDSVNYALYGVLPERWTSRTIKDVYPNIFDWLNVQDVNRNVIFIIMSVVAVINLITCLLILVLERTRMTGILKALGSTDWTIQKIFLNQASVIALRGVVYGVVAGLGIALLQKYTGFIKLDEAAYYVSEAPVTIVWWHTVLVAAATIIVCYLSLLLPTFLVKKVDPVKAIRFN